MDLQQDSPTPPSDPRSHRIVSKLASLLSARWIREIFQAVFLIYLARVSTYTYGEFMLALSLGSILLLIAEFGLNLPLVGLLSQKDEDPKEVLTQMLLLKTGLLTLAYVGVVGFVYWQKYSSPLWEFALVISLGMGLEAISTTFFTALQVQGRQPQEGKIRAVAAFLGFGYGFAALLWGAPLLAVALFKPIETLVNITWSAWAVGLRGLWHCPSLAGLGVTLRRVFIFAILEVSAVLYNKANIFFLQRYGGAEGVAQYSATWQIVDGCSIIAARLILQSVLFPLFVKFWEVDRREVNRLAHLTARWLLCLALVLMLALFLERDRLIPLIYGPHYQQAVWLQQFLVVTILFSFFHNLAGFLIISMRLERLLVAVYLAALVLNLLFCGIAIPISPLWGAALAIILTKGGMALVTYGFIQRRLHILNLRDLLEIMGSFLVGLGFYKVSLFFLRRGWSLTVGVLVMSALWRYWGVRGKRRAAAEQK